jgi:hypothetical protein
MNLDLPVYIVHLCIHLTRTPRATTPTFFLNGIPLYLAASLGTERWGVPWIFAHVEGLDLVC